jgi:hypothetical protein
MEGISSLPSVRNLQIQHEDINEELLRVNGGIHGYSLIRLLEKE